MSDIESADAIKVHSPVGPRLVLRRSDPDPMNASACFRCKEYFPSIAVWDSQYEEDGAGVSSFRGRPWKALHSNSYDLWARRVL